MRDNILFVCVGNTCRSQMAEGFALKYAGGSVGVKSAGTSAMGSVNRTTAESMAEIGIDISRQTSNSLTPDMLNWATVVVTMGCAKAKDICPESFQGKTFDWPIADPLGRPPEFFRQVRDDIGARVKALIDELRK